MSVPSHRSRRRASAARARIVRELAQIDHILPGTVTERIGRCGKAKCPCREDPPRLHGPYISWTRKVEAKTVTRIFTPEQWADYKPWFDNNRRLGELVSELEALSLEDVDADPRWRR